jgi:transcriptional regulator with XRE-family HTH domain
MKHNLIKVRKAKKLTQEGLGKLVGLTKSGIWNIEHGRSNGQVIVWDRLEKVLGVPQKKLRAEDDINAPSRTI